MHAVRRQTIEVFSAGCSSGTPYNYTVHMPNRAIACNPNQSLRISLAQFTCFNPFYNVNDTNNKFAFTVGGQYDPLGANGVVIPVIIPPGTYRFRELALAINAFTAPLVTCTFNSPTNGFVFAAPNDKVSLHFFGESWKLLGFAETDLPYGVSFASTRTIDPQPFRTLNIALDGVTPDGCANYSNSSGTMKASTSLMCMAIGKDVKPFDNLVYTAPSNGTFAVRILDKTLNELRIAITDHAGADLSSIPEHSLLLQVEVLDSKDGSHDTLVQMWELMVRQLELTRLNVLKSVL